MKAKDYFHTPLVLSYAVKYRIQTTKKRARLNMTYPYMAVCHLEGPIFVVLAKGTPNGHYHLLFIRPPVTHPQMHPATLPSSTNMVHLTEDPFKGKLIFQVPSHRCRVSGKEGAHMYPNQVPPLPIPLYINPFFFICELGQDKGMAPSGCLYML